MIILRILLGVAMIAYCGGDKFSILQNKIYAMESSLHQDIQLLRANVALHNEEILNMVEFIKASMALFGNRQDLFGKETSSTIETSSANAENMQYKNTDTVIDDKRVDEEIRVIKRALHDEKRYTRDLHTDLNGNLDSLAAEQLTINVKLDIIATEQSGINVRLDSMATDVSKLNDKLDSITTEQLTINSKLDSITNGQSSITVKLDSTATEQSNINGKLDSIVAEQSNINVKLDSLAAHQSTIHVTLDTIASEQPKLNVTLDTMTSRLSRINEQMDSITMKTRELFVQRGNVRLFNISYDDTDTELAGRLEVLHNYQWGTVCDDYFVNVSATVVCREFGYASGVEKEKAYFGRGSGRIWLDDVICVGTESGILQCPNRGFGVENCDHSEDVGVICS